MKNVIKVAIVLSLVAVMLLSLVACGNKPSGTYASSNGVVSVLFDGNAVTVTFKVFGLSSSAEGTFEMGENNEILITYEKDGEADSAPSGWTYDKENDAIKCSFLGAEISLAKADK